MARNQTKQKAAGKRKEPLRRRPVRGAEAVTPVSNGQDAAPQERSPRVSVRLCRPGSDRCETLPPERISDMLPQEGTLLWVDIQDAGETELEMLREEFG